MQCKDVKNLLDDYIDGTLDASHRQQLVRHTESCAGCQQQLAAYESLRGALREMPVEPARENFAAEAMRAALSSRKASRQQHPGFLHWFGAGFAGAMVAGLALWGVIFGFQPWQQPAPAASFSIAVHQQKNIALAFNAPADVKGVTVSINLPEEFELAGRKGRRQLTWTTDLKKGRNVLRLPVVATGKGKGMMVAELKRDKRVKTLRILLTAEKPDLSQYRITSGTAV